VDRISFRISHSEDIELSSAVSVSEEVERSILWVWTLTARIRIANESLPVAVLGWQSDIERVLSASDMVVLTSDNEGTPISLIQAGMAGLPVVTTRVGSVPEVVLDGVTGMITSLSVQDIADALEKLVIDKGLRAKLGAAAQIYTSANFSLQRLVGDHEELYKRLLSNQAKS
jgi:glycosyltransferase involved in cell wall biosynthesis